MKCVLQESHSVSDEDERLESGRKTIMIQVRDNGPDYSSRNERNGQIPKTFLRSGGRRDLVNEPTLKGKKSKKQSRFLTQGVVRVLMN